MSIGILGKKLGMSQLFDDNGNAVPVTLIEAGPCRVTQLKTNKCLAIFAPLEGGYETRLLRRMRAKGFKTFITSARGLGDPEVFLLKLHGVRPPHLGHQSVGRNGALGEVQQVIPQASELFNENDKNKLLWLLEGQVLSQSELESLIEICTNDNKLTIVVEMGGSRKLEWKPLSNYILDEFES